MRRGMCGGNGGISMSCGKWQRRRPVAAARQLSMRGVIRQPQLGGGVA